MISHQDIVTAAARLVGQVVETPFVRSRTLSRIVGAQIWLKFENLQFTASFKERGALNKLAAMLEGDVARPPGVITASAGNHAQGVAYHAQRLGLPATVVMPESTPAVKIDRTAGFGADVVLHGATFDEAQAHARQLAGTSGLAFVHPFDDELVMAGQGTLALEMLRQQPEVDTLVVPVGGGGLIAGMATAVRALRPDIALVGVQSDRFPSMLNAVKGLDMARGVGTIAEGIAVGEAGRITREVVRERVDDLLVVDEGHIEQAVLMLLEIEKTVVEGAGAAGLAALLDQPGRFAGRKVGLVLSGGNIDPLLLAQIIGRGMVRAGRLARIRVGARDRPGVLAAITAIVARVGANIDEVHHQREFSSGAVQSVDVELVVQTRDRAQVETLVRALNEAGFEARPG